MQERRKYPRIEASVRVTFSSRDHLISEYTQNISQGGMFLKTEEPIDPNAEVRVTLIFPDGKKEFELVGRVRRLMSVSHPTDEGKQLYGVGIAFSKTPEEMVREVAKLKKQG